MNTTTTPTISVRRANERGHSNFGWLDSHHTFSFGEYFDLNHVGYRSLRVINDDQVDGGKGFGTHPHQSMEIFSYVIEGALAHKDSMGNGRTISAGEFQYMSAGSGVMHSEFNPSETEKTHFLQIWIVPAERGGEPRYQELDTRKLRQPNTLALLASPDGRDGSIAMRQNAEIHFGDVKAGQTVAVPLDADHGGNWLHVIAGQVSVAGETLRPGDGASIEASQGEPFEITASEEAEFLLFRLA